MSPAGVVGAAAGPLVLSGVVGRGTFTAALDLRVDPGEVVALMGPNGAGKSTVVRTVAGLEPLRSGRLALGERLLDGAETTRPGRRPAGTVAVPVAARRVGTVFQDHRLFPHLTALGNVAFGPHSQGVRRRAAESTAQGWLDRLGVGALASRRPHELSGGQAQRVAVARALAAEP
ncbi:MAG: transporter ATP-binding protein, partial [Actinotalea sp.]|nr:transporter ATP-binding protein [Actinotalea sp.]